MRSAWLSNATLAKPLEFLAHLEVTWRSLTTELAVLVTYLLNDVEKRRDQRKANARLNTLSPKTVVSQVERVCFLRNSDTLSLGCRAFTEIQRALLRSGTTRLWRV